MAEDDRVGWEIEGKFYPHNGFESLTHGDYALIADVTGLTTDQFLLEEDTLRTESGWIAVAFWQGNPGMKRHHVAAMMEKLPIEGAKRIGFIEQDDAGPPDETTDTGSKSPTSVEPPADAPSPTRPSRSDTESTAEPPPAPSTPNGSGGPRSATGATSDHPISDHLTSSAA